MSQHVTEDHPNLVPTSFVIQISPSSCHVPATVSFSLLPKCTRFLSSSPASNSLFSLEWLLLQPDYASANSAVSICVNCHLFSENACISFRLIWTFWTLPSLSCYSLSTSLQMHLPPLQHSYLLACLSPPLNSELLGDSSESFIFIPRIW